MRKSLGRSLVILGNFYACIHTAIQVWIRQEQGDIADPSSPGRLLDRARFKLFSEEMALLSNLRINGEFTKYEPTIGGRFPKESYDKICDEVQMILISMDLMAHSTRDLDSMAGRTPAGSGRSTTSCREPQESRSATMDGKSTTDTEGSPSPESSYRHRRHSYQTQESQDDARQSDDSPEGSHGEPRPSNSQDNDKWINRLAEATSGPNFHYHFIASVLFHLSAAVSNGLSMPPYLTPPHPFPLARNLRQAGGNLLDIQNVEDPSFSAFVAVEVLSRMVSSNMKLIVR